MNFASPLQFVINVASGNNDPADTRQAIEAALKSSGRAGQLLFTHPDQLAAVSHQAAAVAGATGTAVVAVGGDGTISSVAQAAHAAGCVMGLLPQGTFNYFARTHRIPTDASEALQALLTYSPVPVQVGRINDRVFLVNASLGLYPELLQDREAYAERYGRSRLVALWSTLATLLGTHRQLRLRIECDTRTREVRTPTLFVGNNRLQLEQMGLQEAPALDRGCIAAVMLRPIPTPTMFWLLLRGAIGTLGEADTVESFAFHRMIVKSRLAWGRHAMKVALDGEVCWMHSLLEFSVSPQPLYLLKPGAAAGAADLAQDTP